MAKTKKKTPRFTIRGTVVNCWLCEHKDQRFAELDALIAQRKAGEVAHG